MEKGIKGLSEIIVDENRLACNVGSGELPVYATPSLISDVEQTAWKSIAGHLEDGQTTVGTKVVMDHIAATIQGMKVTIETILSEIDRRRLVFDVNVYDEVKKIAKGTHERFIVDKDKFMEKAEKK